MNVCEKISFTCTADICLLVAVYCSPEHGDTIQGFPVWHVFLACLIHIAITCSGNTKAFGVNIKKLRIKILI